MNSIPFSSLDLQASDITAITEIFDSLKDDYQVSYDTNFSYDFATLEIFRNRKVSNGPAIKLANESHSFDLVFINIGYSYAYGRKYSHGATYEYQTWGITTLKNDLGHILINRETLLDKIHELINPIEIDFPDDPGFSKHFFVVADNEIKARTGLTKSFRTALNNLDLKDFIIEIRNNQLIIGNRKIIEKDSAIQIVNFLDNLSRLY